LAKDFGDCCRDWNSEELGKDWGRETEASLGFGGLFIPEMRIVVELLSFRFTIFHSLGKVLYVLLPTGFERSISTVVVPGSFFGILRGRLCELYSVASSSTFSLDGRSGKGCFCGMGGDAGGLASGRNS